MDLLVGLGNPGREYETTRHNIGFMAADAIAARYDIGPWKSRFLGQAAEGRLPGMDDKVLLLKPETYMNRSGGAVSAAMQFYKIPLDRVFVFHDELDLMPGRVRVKKGGGAAGHNGLRSIDQMVGPDYWRVRLGIGHPGDKNRVHDYVLGSFAAADRDWITPVLAELAAQIALLLGGKDALFMTRLAAALPKPPAPEKTAIKEGSNDGL